jgi:integrase
MSKKRRPSYLLHKATRQARVRIDGKDEYLGEYGSPESRERYDDLIAEWFARNGDTSRYKLTIDDLALLFVDHAKSYYRTPDGKLTAEVCSLQHALRPLVELFGTIRVREFGPLKLKQVRDRLIENGHCRTNINRMIGRIKRAFKWGVENEYVPSEVHTALTAVPGLRAGRSKAVESAPVKPAPDSFVNAVEPHVSRQIWGMIQLQLLTGARPGEITAMRGCDLKTDETTWEYRPKRHKTQHRGKSRVVFLGPKAQAIVRAFLKTDTQAYLFSPRDVVDEFNARRRAERKSPMTPSQSKRSRKTKPKRQAGERYTKDSYRVAIQRGCDRAEIPRWTPHQLRHNSGTWIRREADIDTARTVLGHSTLDVTEIYAEKDYATARSIMARIG